MLSHELRTPLNAIMGWVSVLMRRNPPPEVGKGLEAIERNVRTQSRIIADILDVSRINSGKLTLERELADPAEIVVSALGSLRQALQERQLQLHVDVEAGRGPAWIDPARYQQIIWNLVTNAIKFSSPGGVIEVLLTRADDQLRLQVRDTGQGIAPDFLDRLFDRFTQAQAPGNRVHSGLGLGLSIVRQLAELHDGTVQASSEGLGHGATFTVDIPLAAVSGRPAASTPPVASTRAPEAADEDHLLAGLTVLLVEDDPDASEIVSVILADRGATVRLAADVQGALASAQSVWPDLLLSDIGLPHRDGHDLIRVLRAMQGANELPYLAAIALTAFARPQDCRQALEAGFDRHLPKPLNPHALMLNIRELVPLPGRTAQA